MSDRGQDITQDLLRLSAQKLCADLNGRSTDGVWQAQLERSTNGRHVSLSFYCPDEFVGSFDHRGWHAPSAQRRHQRPRPLVRSLPLPLAS
jgi:hypothetical protein